MIWSVSVANSIFYLSNFKRCRAGRKYPKNFSNNKAILLYQLQLHYVTLKNNHDIGPKFAPYKEGSFYTHA